MATPEPPISPSVATPLAHRKRRHSEINGLEAKTSKLGNRSHEGPKIPVKARLQVPQPRGRSATPVKRDRSATPSSSAKKPTVKANGALTPRPTGAARFSLSPRPSVSNRPSMSPRSGVSARPSPSPRPKVAARPSASPRPQHAARPSPSPNAKQRVQRRIEDSDSDEDSDVDKSDIEDILDAAELEPFTRADEGDDFKVLDTETKASLRRRLLKIGPQEFMQETLSKAQMPPQTLGTAFGLNPDLHERVGREIFLRILGQMVVRQYFKRQKLPQYNTLDDVAELLKKSSNVIVVAGAGISTSLGIPDFRSRHTGFYDRAKAKAERIGYELNEPEDVFDLETFDLKPELFYTLAGDILPNEKKFSPTHAFIKLLQDKGKLLTCYTQNIDNLEQSAGITKDKLIQCHGSFASATCRRNGVKNPTHHVKGIEIFDDIRTSRVAECKFCKTEIAEAQARKKAQPQRKKSRFQLSATKRTSTPYSDDNDSDDDIAPGIMKPDITFFGEQLPNTFFERFTEKDCKVVDLVLVLGTSLKVAPVSEMPNYLPHEVPHVYVSREAIRHVEFDVQCLGDCDDVVVELCRRAGWSGSDGKGVWGHAMVEAKDGEGTIIDVKGEEEGEEEQEDGREVCKWRVRREALF